MGLTEKQQQAVDTRDRSLLVSAAAGSGKTSTLTARIIASLLDEKEPADLSRMLIVTFTNAATDELREKITKALTGALAANPNNARLERQLRLLPTASIKTIDAFCNDVLKNVAEAVGLPPGYRVPDRAEIDLLRASVMRETVGGLFDGTYADAVTAEDFADLCDCLTLNRSDSDAEVCLTYLYLKTQTHEDGVRSLHPLVEKYRIEDGAPLEENELVGEAVDAFLTSVRYYLGIIRAGAAELLDEGDEKYLPAYEELLETLEDLAARRTYRAIREGILNLSYPDLPNLSSKAPVAAKDLRHFGFDPLKDEITEYCKHLFAYSEEDLRSVFAKLYRVTGTLVRVLEIFDRVFRTEKKRLGVCEYSDMEYYTCEALWGEDGKPTDYALSLREQYDAVYIDEYQDVNRLQDKIFRAVSRPDNRFTVGDIKQSIYAFRNADPTIFGQMKKTYPSVDDGGDCPEASLFMSENFRCDRPIVDFVNEVFDTLFTETSESIGYVKDDRLRFAKKYDSEDVVPPRPVEILHVIHSSKKKDTPADAEANVLNSARAEAAAIAEKIRELMETGVRNRPDESGSRKLHYSDIAILMRSTSTRGPQFAAELEARGIPVSGEMEGDLLKSPEVLLTLCLLGAIDNPCRDIFLSGAMLSPLFGFTPDDLVAIRTSGKKGVPLYRALVAYTEAHPEFSRGKSFIETLSDYRRISEGMPTEKFLYRLYRETGLFAVATEHGRQENLLRLYEYARTFEKSSYRGLYAFVSYLCRVLERKETFGGGGESSSADDRVKIVTIHKSKGLEYPVVILSGAGSNIYGTKTDAAEKFLAFKTGFALSLTTPDEKGLSLVSNPVFDLIKRKNDRGAFEEELRILYVALTRAKEKLIVTGIVPDEDARRERLAFLKDSLSPETFYRQTTYLDLIELTGASAKVTAVEPKIAEDGEPDAETCDGESAENPNTGTRLPPETEPEALPDDALVTLLEERFSSDYKNPALTRVPEKLSVSVLHPGILDDSKEDEDLTIEEGALSLKPKSGRRALPDFYTGTVHEDGTKRGIATHQFMQFCDFDRLRRGTVEEELDRLVSRRFLSEEDREKVNADELELFRRSDLLAEMCRAEKKYREFRFNVLLDAEKFTDNPEMKKDLHGEKLLVQGVIDCLFKTPEGEYVLVDYKTDRLTADELRHPERAAETLANKHRRQLTYYAEAVREMFGVRPAKILVYSLPLGGTVSIED